MITMTEVLQGDKWDGKSLIEQDGGGVAQKDNLESTMNFAEHQRIVVDAKALLAGAIATGNAQATAMFENLQKTYNENTPGMVVVITKGIHQIGSDAHIQVRLVAEAQRAQANAGVKFHLNVEDVALDTDGLIRRSQWRATQFKGWIGKTAYWWPAPERRISKDRRRNSISAVDLAAHVLHMEEEARAAEKLKADTEKNAAWQRALEKFKAANTDLVYKPGPSGIKSLREAGALVMPIKNKLGKSASLTWDGVTITRKNL